MVKECLSKWQTMYVGGGVFLLGVRTPPLRKLSTLTVGV